MNKKITSLYFRLILILILEAIIMYFGVPLLLGYPPHSESFPFQTDILGPFPHIVQYITFITLGLIVYVPSLNWMFKNTRTFLKSKNKKEVSEDVINKVRKEFFKSQPRLMFFYIVICLAIIISAYMLIEFSLATKIKFAIVYLLLSSLAWVISVTFIRRFMLDLLEGTYEVFPQYDSFNKKSKFQQTIISNLFPIFATVIGILVIFLYSNTINLNGDKIYEYYKTQLQNQNYENVSISKVEENLKKVEKKKNADFYFILDKESDNKLVEKGYDSNAITDFFIKYANRFVEDNEGRTYEFFGAESEAFIKKVVLDDGNEIWIGLKYSTSDKSILATFVVVTLIVFALYTIVVVVWAKNMSYTLRAISTSLANIANQKDIEQYTAIPIYSYDEIGELAHSYNEIQKINNEHIEEIRKNQKTKLEHERLVSLGQMIGGIAHNLKTPILSIAGAAEGIKYLSEEMEASLTTDTVTLEDKKEILKEQEEWVEKIKVHLEYMNDIITAVKGQATTFTTEREERFTVRDLFKNVDMLTSHEFKNALTELEIIDNVPSNKYIKGDFNSLLQIVNNIVINAIQSYEGKPNGKVQVIANIGSLSGNLVISVRDQGKGMSKDIQDKLFKQMVTTKGKYGTGLGLYMSYSTIKGKFQGEIKFESEEGKGSVFHIILPSIEKDENAAGDIGYISEQSSIGGTVDTVQKQSKRSDVYNKNEAANKIKDNESSEKTNKSQEKNKQIKK